MVGDLVSSSDSLVHQGESLNAELSWKVGRLREIVPALMSPMGAKKKEKAQNVEFCA
jgi:hypothetical protein